MNKKLSLLLFPLILAIGCSSNNLSNGENGEPEKPIDEPVEVVEKGKLLSPNYGFEIRNSKEEFTYHDLFNLNNKVEVTIKADKEELQKIEDDKQYGRKSEIYHLAKEVTISIINNGRLFTWVLENVGIRQKGNTSREAIFYDDVLNTHNHYKLSFDETFTDKEMYSEEFIAEHGNKEYGDRTFLGLSGLDFKWNRNLDSTHIKEVYASYMYKSAGVIAQNVGLSSLRINTDGYYYDFGLCFIYEQTSKSMIKEKFSSNEEYLNTPSWDIEKSGDYGVPNKKYGDYYKVGYGAGDGYGYGGGGDMSLESIKYNRVGVKTDIYGKVYPVYERKTNKDSDYNDILLKEMVSTLDGGSYSEIDKKVDLEYFAIEEAANYFIGNPDSCRYNYNNYMMYFRRTDGKMMLIPIDNDRTFGVGHTWDKGVTFGANEGVTPFDDKDVNWNRNRNNLFLNTLFAKGNNACKETYEQYIRLFADSVWMKNETFVNFYNIAKKTYQGVEQFDLSGGNDNISFESYMNIKLKSVKAELK